MNFKNAGIAEIEAIASQFPEYTLGQIIHAIISRKPEEVIEGDQKPRPLSIKDWLFNVSDEDLYTAIEKSKLIEKEY